MERNILPLLPRPVLYDLAWNYIEYPKLKDDEPQAKKRQDSPQQPRHHSQEQHANNDEPDRANRDNQGGGWLSGLFGNR